MPRMKASKKLKRSNAQQNGAISDSQSDDEPDRMHEIGNASDSDSKLSSSDREHDIPLPEDFSGGMSKLFERFSTDLNKTLHTKKRKLEQFTQESTKSTTKKVLETHMSQSNERKQLVNHLQAQMSALIQQGEEEMDKFKEGEVKLQKALVQQQKHQQQMHISHTNRWKALKNLGEEFCKGMNELEDNHVEQYSAVNSELKKEMALLQKKILMDIQQQEMMNIRKQLTQMLP